VEYGLSILTSSFKVNAARIFFEIVLGFICIVVSVADNDVCVNIISITRHYGDFI
jgi:hypothetical protein